MLKQLAGGALAALSPLRVPAQAMVVALAGAGMAWLCLNGRWELAALATVAIVLIGVGCDIGARAAITKSPLVAIYLFQGWLLIPLAVAVLASAAIIVLVIKTTLPKENAAGEPTSTETEKLVGAVSTGITTFLTAAFVSWVGDGKDSKLADHIQACFEGRFTDQATEKPGAWVIKDNSPAMQWVFAGACQGIEGWGWKARAKRARGVKEALKAKEITKPS
jgi:hypothetical protein